MPTSEIPKKIVRQKLLSWYSEHQRDLPWRRTKDPYAIWISEVMLQQTRVETVIPYYERFIQRWPNPTALAAANPDEVRSAWSGLGYYRRCQMMLNASQKIAEDYAGELPADKDALSQLPGFGRYTAGAVASIAFDLQVGAVDGNVSRVLARMLLIEGDLTKAENNRRLWAFADDLALGCREPGELTQALIELGATLCGKTPKCMVCPVRVHCRAQRDGKTDVIPYKKAKAKQKKVELSAVLFTHGSLVALQKRPKKGLFPELWVPPLFDKHVDSKSLAKQIKAELGVEASQLEVIGEARHVLTHRELQVLVFKVETSVEPTDCTWVNVHKLDEFGVPSFTTKILKMGVVEAVAPKKWPGRSTKLLTRR